MDPIIRDTDSPADSIPRAVPADAKQHPSTNINIGLYLVGLILALILIRINWPYLSGSLYPRFVTSLTGRFAKTVSPAPGPLHQTTRKMFENSIVSYDDNGLLISNIDGTNPERLQTGETLRMIAVEADRTTYLYSARHQNRQSVYQASLRDQKPELLLSFTIRGANAKYIESNVSQSPDEKYLAYSHDDGVLSLYDIAARQDRLLQLSVACERTSNHACRAFFNPVWSPNGNLLLLRETFYDSSTLVVTNPFDDSGQLFDLKKAGPTPQWLPSATAVLAAGEYEGLYYLGHLSDITTNDILRDTFGSQHIQVTSQLLSTSSLDAVVYASQPTAQNYQKIGIYDIKMQRFRKIYTAPDKDTRLKIVSWGPLDTSIIVELTHGPKHSYVEVALTGEIKELPLIGRFQTLVKARN